MKNMYYALVACVALNVYQTINTAIDDDYSPADRAAMVESKPVSNNDSAAWSSAPSSAFMNEDQAQYNYQAPQAGMSIEEESYEMPPQYAYPAEEEYVAPDQGAEIEESEQLSMYMPEEEE